MPSHLGCKDSRKVKFTSYFYIFRHIHRASESLECNSFYVPGAINSSQFLVLVLFQLHLQWVK